MCPFADEVDVCAHAVRSHAGNVGEQDGRVGEVVVRIPILGPGLIDYTVEMRR